MEGDERPFDDFRREVQEALQGVWGNVNEKSQQIRALQDELREIRLMIENRSQQFR